jgi:hypothetical protein
VCAVNSYGLGSDPMMSCYEDGKETSSSIKFCAILFLRRILIHVVNYLLFYALRQLKVSKLSRYTPWWRFWGGGGITYSFLTSALEGGEWSASRPGRALPPGKGPPVPFDRRWVDPRADLDAEARRKILCPCRGSNPDRPTSSQTLY